MLVVDHQRQLVQIDEIGDAIEAGQISRELHHGVQIHVVERVQTAALAAELNEIMSRKPT